MLWLHFDGESDINFIAVKFSSNSAAIGVISIASISGETLNILAMLLIVETKYLDVKINGKPPIIT